MSKAVWDTELVEEADEEGETMVLGDVDMDLALRDDSPSTESGFLASVGEGVFLGSVTFIP